MQISAAALFLFAAMGVVATPIESTSSSIDARDNSAVLFQHTGVSRTSRFTIWQHTARMTTNSCGSSY
jgi:hypothetical protein